VGAEVFESRSSVHDGQYLLPSGTSELHCGQSFTQAS
jgi:hypothetical protein